MNAKNLQYIMGHSENEITLNTYTNLEFSDAKVTLKNVWQMKVAQVEKVGKVRGFAPNLGLLN